MQMIDVGARGSPLSRKQVDEVYREVLALAPHIQFTPHFIDTTGDKDQTTSLKFLEKTDFFTKEVDEMLLSRQCRIAIHSAKDLPDPLPDGIVIAAITRGVDPSDSLVLHEDQTFATLPSGALIACSSIRREEAIKSLRQDLRFADIRGTISQRLDQLFSRKVDGVVIAEAALIRLGLTGLNRFKIPGETVPLQGKLAVAVRKGDHEMIRLFANIDYW